MNETVNTGPDDLLIGGGTVNLSLLLLNGIKSIPFRAVVFEGFAFVGKREFYGRIILQTCSKEIDSVLDIGRLLDKIAEMPSDLSDKVMFERFSSDPSMRL